MDRNELSIENFYFCFFLRGYRITLVPHLIFIGENFEMHLVQIQINCLFLGSAPHACPKVFLNYGSLTLRKSTLFQQVLR